ncbi:MAG: gamma-glutamyl-gamma-aminobutyrate hydrolase family protein, partial [Comamonadaceae bacterium]
MPKNTHKPLVWLPACHRHLDLSDPGGYTVLADRYAAAVTALGLQPVLFPMAEADDVMSLLPLVDGVLLTGSPSNVEATHFGATALPTDLLDPRRDKLTMRLVREALAAALPLLGVCRGLQEINVAMGGSLYQTLHDQPGLMDHREPDSEDLE